MIRAWVSRLLRVRTILVRMAEIMRDLGLPHRLMGARFLSARDAMTPLALRVSETLRPENPSCIKLNPCGMETRTR